ncbi:MAG: Hsp20/alpha crystallin family protein [Candidatus Omnitrophica bacterium]|jgi:HSP20 family molecular chaperone IbpA|nr:Hsp20/alpha crystallin family protein [Candidatus Omnitrophota bacterium]
MKNKRIFLMPGVCIYHDSKNDRLLMAEIELPGVKKEDTKLDVNEDGFCIKAKRGNYVYDSCFETLHRIEADKTKAHFEEGLLKLSMPIKSDTADMRTIPIE